VSVHWVPLTADNLSLCARLWSDRQAYTAREFAQAMAVTASLLQQRRAFGALIFENATVRSFGVSAFVDEEPIDRLLEDGHPQIGKRLLLATDSTPESRVILERRQIAEGNANRGLNLMVLNANLDDNASDIASVFGLTISCFHDVHRGYRLARIISEVHGDSSIGIVVRSGAYEIRRHHSDVGGVAGLSSVVGTLTREQATAWSNPLLTMFVYEPPLIAFTEPEQQLLRTALSGAPDAVVAEQLRIPVTAVKARWSRILQRALDAVPAAFPPYASHNGTRRGAQQRHVILEYVRNHPSELTPYPSSRRGRV